MAKTKDDPAAVDQYLETLPAEQRDSLQQLRGLIKTTVPGVRERISYGTAVIFALDRDLVGFVARATYLSFLTMSPQLAKSLKSEITKNHKVSGATIHFTPDHPLPAALVEKILEGRIREQKEQTAR